MNPRRALQGLSLALVVGAVPVAAQEPGPGDRLRVSVSVDSVNTLIATLQRAHLGITVNLLAVDSDSAGALVNSVSPNGPADRAGIRSGDVIVRLAGDSLAEDTEGDDEFALADEGSSLPGLRLFAAAARLQPGDTIDVELLRDGATRHTTLVTEGWPSRVRPWASPEGDWGVRLGDDSMVVERQYAPLVRGRVFGSGSSFFFAGPLLDLELAPMNDDLGRYFGTSEGVLVIRTPEHSELGLEGGDVVLAVDGRVALGPAHLHRILRSYQPDERFELTIMRDHRKQKIRGRLGPR